MHAAREALPAVGAVGAQLAQAAVRIVPAILADAIASQRVGVVANRAARRFRGTRKPRAASGVAAATEGWPGGGDGGGDGEGGVGGGAGGGDGGGDGEGDGGALGGGCGGDGKPGGAGRRRRRAAGLGRRRRRELGNLLGGRMISPSMMPQARKLFSSAKTAATVTTTAVPTMAATIRQSSTP